MEGCFQNPRRGRIFLNKTNSCDKLETRNHVHIKVSQFENLPWTMMPFSIDYWAKHFNEDKAPSKYNNRIFLTSSVCWDESSLCEIVHYGIVSMDMVWYGIVWYMYVYILFVLCGFVVLWGYELAYMQKMLQGLSWICHMQTWEFLHLWFAWATKQAPSRIE